MRHVLIILLLGALLVPGVRAEPSLINGVQVIVNDAIITYKDVQTYLAPVAEMIERTVKDPAQYQQKILDAQREAIEQLVERQLMLYDFKTAGYNNFPESIIEDAIKRDIKEHFGDRLTLTKTLSAQNITYESYRQQTRENIIVDALRYKNVSSEIVISPYKIENYYKENTNDFKLPDQIKLRMIVLNKPAGSSGETQKKLAAEILGKLKEGAAFAEMASIYSEGSQRLDGGNWGWVERTVLREELRDVAFKLKAGERSDVIDLPGACYLMLVEELRLAHVRALGEVRDQIEKNLLLQERARLQKKYIDRLKKKSFIRYF